VVSVSELALRLEISQQLSANSACDVCVSAVIHTGEQEVRGECCVVWSDEGAAGRSDTYR